MPGDEVVSLLLPRPLRPVRHLQKVVHGCALGKAAQLVGLILSTVQAGSHRILPAPDPQLAIMAPVGDDKIAGGFGKWKNEGRDWKIPAALSADLTRDRNERTELFGYRLVLGNLGLLVGAALPMGFLALFGEGANGASAYKISTYVLGAAVIATAMTTFAVGWLPSTTL